MDHPNYVEMSQKNIALLEEIITFCQNRGELREGSVTDITIWLWSSVHGFTNLILENQFPHEYIGDRDLEDLLKVVLAGGKPRDNDDQRLV